MSVAFGSRTRPPDGTGYVTDLTNAIEAPHDGKITWAHVQPIVNTIRALVTAVNGNLSFGDGTQSSRAGNLAAQYIQYKFVDTAIVQAIPHDLGRRPIGWIVVNEKFTARSGGAVPKLVATGEDGSVAYGGADNSVDSVPTAWDHRMIYFTAEGDNAWLPGLFRILLF